MHKTLPLYTTLLITLLSCSAQQTINLDDQSPFVNQNAETQINVSLGTDSSGVQDHSFNAMIWRGITRFYNDTPEYPSKRGLYYDYFISENENERTPKLKEITESGYDLIIVAGDPWFASLNQIAKEHPQQKFAIIYGIDLPHREKNIMQVTYSDEQGSFLVGIAAALKAKEMGATPKFGFIGGLASPVITRFEAGYTQGIRTILPEATILSYYAGSWNDPDKAQAQANEWYKQGIYVIFSAAGLTGNGPLEEAKKHRQRGEDVWAIGVDSDQYKQGLYTEGKSAVLTSMTKRLDAVVQLTLWNLASGKFKTNTLNLDLRNGGIGLPEENPNLSNTIIEEIETYRKKVIKEEIIVAKNLDN